jgi:ribosome biogenesis GTPase A
MEKTGKWIYEGLIHWFPGHMAKAVKEMKEKLPFIHTILEVRDARVSRSKSLLMVNPFCRFQSVQEVQN